MENSKEETEKLQNLEKEEMQNLEIENKEMSFLIFYLFI